MPHDYQVFSTRWDDPRPIEQIPARGLSFSLPLSAHGGAAFSATVEPGRSFWRPSLSVAMAGALVCRDGVPVWGGQLTGERQSGPRTFDFTVSEWGSFFDTVPAAAITALTPQPDASLIVQLVATAQNNPGQNVGLILHSMVGAGVSVLTINPWDQTTVGEEIRRIGDLAGGPEWYVDCATGTFGAPTRTMMIADRLGSTEPSAVLEYVEDTVQYEAPGTSGTFGTAPGSDTYTDTYADIYPGAPGPIVGDRFTDTFTDMYGSGTTVPKPARRGGNVTSFPARQVSPGFTQVRALGAGSQGAQIHYTAAATDLLNAGYARRTTTASLTNITNLGLLRRHGDADLAAARGMTTSYTLATFEDDPDWTQVARGDLVQVILDTDVFGGIRPLTFNSRVLDRKISVPDVGPVTVDWTIATVQEL